MLNKPVKILRIGLTGGFGAGKSTVSKIFKTLGANIVDVDLAGRWAVDNDKAVRDQILQNFGPHLFLAETLNRKALASIVFSDYQKLELLNSIVHPVMLKRVDWLLEHPQIPEAKMTVVDAALLFELNLDEKVEKTITILAQNENVISRAMARDSISRKDVLNRLDSQMDMQKKAGRSDFVILAWSSHLSRFQKHIHIFLSLQGYGLPLLF